MRRLYRLLPQAGVISAAGTLLAVALSLASLPVNYVISSILALIAFIIVVTQVIVSRRSDHEQAGRDRKLDAVKRHIDHVDLIQRRTAMLDIYEIQDAILALSLPYHKAEPWDNLESDPLSDKARELEDLRLNATAAFRDLEPRLKHHLNTAIQLGIPVDAELNNLLLMGVSTIGQIDDIAAALNRTINASGGTL